MKIEYNEKEIAAMAEFHKGNRAEGLRLQEEFASEFRKEYAWKLQRMCGNSQSPSGTRSKLHAPDDQ